MFIYGGPSYMYVFMYMYIFFFMYIYRWVSQLSFVRWSFAALAINEFRGLAIDCPPHAAVKADCARSGDQVTMQKYMYVHLHECIYLYIHTHAHTRTHTHTHPPTPTHTHTGAVKAITGAPVAHARPRGAVGPDSSPQRPRLPRPPRQPTVLPAHPPCRTPARDHTCLVTTDHAAVRPGCCRRRCASASAAAAAACGTSVVAGPGI